MSAASVFEVFDAVADKAQQVKETSNGVLTDRAAFTVQVAELCQQVGALKKQFVAAAQVADLPLLVNKSYIIHDRIGLAIRNLPVEQPWILAELIILERARTLAHELDQAVIARNSLVNRTGPDVESTSV